jgi:PRTRC genetic system protein E
MNWCIRVNVLPKKLADSENAALTTPMSFTGTAAELDAQLPDAIVSFVGAPSLNFIFR